MLIPLGVCALSTPLGNPVRIDTFASVLALHTLSQLFGSYPHNNRIALNKGSNRVQSIALRIKVLRPYDADAQLVRPLLQWCPLRKRRG